MKKCNKCKKEKNESEFGNNKRMPDGLRSICKLCRHIPKELHKFNAGRFRKDFEPWNKGTQGICKPWNKGIKTGNIPWNKDKPCREDERERLRLYNEEKKKKAKSRSCLNAREWSRKVRERDGNKCTKCESTNRLAAHHIIPWREREDLRFDMDNGITLCCSCHAILEGFQIGHAPVNRKKEKL